MHSDLTIHVVSARLDEAKLVHHLHELPRRPRRRLGLRFGALRVARRRRLAPA